MLRFASSAAYANGAGAEAVFGQANFTTSTANGTNGTVGDSTLNGPQGVAIDANGTLWVADTSNNRVVGYENAATVQSGNGSAVKAEYVLGQVGFSTNAIGTTQSTMRNPTGVALDANGALYVVDKTNNRILKFSDPYIEGDGITAINADGLFGQTNYLSSAFANPPTAASLRNPTSAKVDENGNLWIADSSNHRVLRIPSIATAGVGASADLVIGQTDFIIGTTTTTSATTLSNPSNLAFDNFGRLYIADTSYNRVLVYNAPNSLSNGAAASFVLGQADFTSALVATTQNGLRTPRGLVFSAQSLWVADSANHRVLSYSIAPGTPSFSGPSTTKLSTTKEKRINIVFQNASTASDKFTLRATLVGNARSLGKYVFTINGTDVTSQLLNGTYSTALLNGSQTVPITVTVSAKSKAKKKGGKISITFSATSQTSSSATAQRTFNGNFPKKKSKK